jgi:hypothetical protein
MSDNFRKLKIYNVYTVILSGYSMFPISDTIDS